MIFDQFSKKYDIGVKVADSFVCFLSESRLMLAQVFGDDKEAACLVSLKETLLADLSFDYLHDELSDGLESVDCKAYLMPETIEKIKDQIYVISLHYINVRDDKIADYGLSEIDKNAINQLVAFGFIRVSFFVKYWCLSFSYW